MLLRSRRPGPSGSELNSSVQLEGSDFPQLSWKHEALNSCLSLSITEREVRSKRECGSAIFQDTCSLFSSANRRHLLRCWCPCLALSPALWLWLRFSKDVPYSNRFYFYLYFLDRVSCSPGWPHISCRAKDDLLPLTFLLLPPKLWGTRACPTSPSSCVHCLES